MVYGSKIIQHFTFTYAALFCIVVIRDILQSNDLDSKGYLTTDELADSLQALGFTPDQDDVDFLVKHMDDDGNVTAQRSI